MHFMFPPNLGSFGSGLLLSVVFFVGSGFFFDVTGGGVRGFVKDEKGEPLAYTTIFVKQTGSGTTTNVNGAYEIALAAGHNELVYQFLGYETVTQQVDIAADFVEVNVTL